MTIESSHAEMVAKLAKPGADILRDLTPEKADLWHMASLLVAEAGEIMSEVKAHVIYGKRLDGLNMREELGDCEFAMQGIRRNLGITRETTLYGNMDKLGRRYPGLKFSNSDAIERKDKV